MEIRERASLRLPSNNVNNNNNNVTVAFNGWLVGWLAGWLAGEMSVATAAGEAVEAGEAGGSREKFHFPFEHL